MASLRDIKRRITSVKSTQKITRAMKMVSAAKLRRAQQSIVQARPYAHRMRQLVHSLALRAEHDLHPLLRRGPVNGPVGLIVVTSDRGLCGAYNTNIVNNALRIIRDDFADRDVEVTVIGRKGADLLRTRLASIRQTHTGVMDASVIDAASTIISDIAGDFAQGNTAEVHCLYNEFKSAISQNVTLEQLLPFKPEEPGDGSVVDYIYEPSDVEVFDALLEKHMMIQMHRILSEAAASEHGARMTAMDAATSNAGDMIERLTLQFNRARQDAITKELIEVVSGAEAL